MFKGHPKGLFVLAIANMGERFGYYTMLAIFVLFMQAKFGFTTETTSTIFGTFLALVYFLPLFGGIVADRVLGYGKTVILGVVVMFLGYFLLAIPTGTDTIAKVMMFGALALIAIGTGFFKGNLQALVGNLYDDPKYSSKRDLAFSIFYMCINIGAFYAPTAAEKVTNFFLGKHGLTYESKIPALVHQLKANTISDAGLQELTSLANAQTPGAGSNLAEFGNNYITHLSEAYNYGFGVACISLIVSLLVFLVFRKAYKHADVTALQQAKTAAASGNKQVEELTPQQTKERMIALFLVFFVVIFFWMSFHQNGLTMTFFARDYTESSVTGIERFSFSIVALTFFIVAFYGLLNVFQSKKTSGKLIGAGVFIAGAVAAYAKYTQLNETEAITPQIFQQFNPFFIIILTPIFVAIFSSLNKKGKEPSAPRKIGFGMLIAAIGFVLLSLGSIGLPVPTGEVSNTLVSPNWLISTYFVLTIAELFLSPMGISFVSRVAPPKYKGIMQGGWLAATAVGNYLTAVIGYMWGGMPLWMLWGVLVVCCLLSALFIFSIMKRLERITNNA